jgi:hypothetical protein
MVRVARAMATATKRAMATNGNTVSMAMKRTMATDGDNTGNGYNEEAGGQATVATMAMAMGTVRRTWPLMLLCYGGNGPWFVRVFVSVERPQIIRLDLKIVNAL